MNPRRGFGRFLRRRRCLDACSWPGTVRSKWTGLQYLVFSFILRRHNAPSVPPLRTSPEKSGPASYPTMEYAVNRAPFDFRPGLVMNGQAISGLGRRLIARHSPFVSATHLPRIRHLPSPLHPTCMRPQTRVCLGYRRVSRRAPRHDLIQTFTVYLV